MSNVKVEDRNIKEALVRISNHASDIESMATSRKLVITNEGWIGFKVNAMNSKELRVGKWSDIVGAINMLMENSIAFKQLENKIGTYSTIREEGTDIIHVAVLDVEGNYFYSKYDPKSNVILTDMAKVTLTISEEG